MYETGEADYNFPIVLNDEYTREEFVALGIPMAGETYDYYGKDGVKGAGTVKNFTTEHIGDQAMESLISIGEHYADKIKQPALIIYSKTNHTASCSITFIEKLTNEHEVMELEEFGHVDFYYKPDAIKVSADAAAEFLNK